jgi:hypothetical protein
MITSGAAPNRSATSLTAQRIISRGTGLMAGSPGGIRRPGLVTVPTSAPARNTTAGQARANGRLQQRAMGNIGIIASIFDDPRYDRALSRLKSDNGKCCPRTTRQPDFDGVRATARGERLIVGTRRSSRSGADGPAAAQGACMPSTLCCIVDRQASPMRVCQDLAQSAREMVR